MNYHYKFAGDRAILVVFGDELNEVTSKKVRKLAELVDGQKILGIEEVILGYTSLLVNYNPIKISYTSLQTTLDNLILQINLTENESSKTIEIPVLYGGNLGPDLPEVARLNNLKEADVIQIHTESEYTVYFLGFTPGFPFLGGMSKKIATPRLENPRKRIEAGSVGIAGYQTGIYPVNSPGGWRLIGRTPISLYDPNTKNPFLLSPGDIIKFKSITKEVYEELVKTTKKGGRFDV
ncbi:5-oxoprolinase subunit PxpB [Ornithinibacillus californiensis]|uniref:5-oxoprolinase subunit PxpB n=1 Tax=Ornithinibacillus californiensis TaxID=161536 RepID=UPI00064DF2F8|nr:5-oxoprolinase subunit PxpB [Ornithinibacillus californiensis]